MGQFSAAALLGALGATLLGVLTLGILIARE